jgi:ubiquinone biosynthesis protein UbiJ
MSKKRKQVIDLTLSSEESEFTIQSTASDRAFISAEENTSLCEAMMYDDLLERLDQVEKKVAAMEERIKLLENESKK